MMYIETRRMQSIKRANDNHDINGNYHASTRNYLLLPIQNKNDGLNKDQ